MSWLFCQETEAPGPNDFHAEHGDRMFKWTVKIVLALSCCVLFLGPVGILYLVDLPQNGLYGVTVAFSVLFDAIMVAFEDRIGPMLLGNCAYSKLVAPPLPSSYKLRKYPFSLACSSSSHLVENSVLIFIPRSGGHGGVPVQRQPIHSSIETVQWGWILNTTNDWRIGSGGVILFLYKMSQVKATEVQYCIQILILFIS